VKVRVITAQLKRNDRGRISGVVDSASKLIEWNDRSDRKWLESHQHWAMCNDHEVAIHPEVTRGN
jgi:hypothetical protein